MGKIFDIHKIQPTENYIWYER